MAGEIKVTFHQADDKGRKGMVKMGRGFVKMMLAGKRSGDHVLVEIDGQPPQPYRILAEKPHPKDEGLTITLEPGAEP